MIDYLISRLPSLLPGLGKTIALTILGLGIGTPLGIMMAFGRSFGHRFLSFPIYLYEKILRGTPLLVIFFMIYLGLSQIGINLGPFKSAVLGLGLRSTAYQAQIFRGSINSIPEGQMSAALSIGMSRIKSARHVILPQVLRLSIPGWSNEFTIVLKDTSIAYAIGATELMRQGRYIMTGINAPENIPLVIFTIIAAIYFVLVISTNKFLSYLEDKYRMTGFEVDIER